MCTNALTHKCHVLTLVPTVAHVRTLSGLALQAYLPASALYEEPELASIPKQSRR